MSNMSGIQVRVQTLHAQIGEQHYQATVLAERNGALDLHIICDGERECRALLDPECGLEPLGAPYHDTLTDLLSQDDWTALDDQFREELDKVGC
jgi:hypothetical protein